MTRGVQTQLTEERIAQLFHEAYERLAPEFGYETRRESAVPWEDVPEQNKRLMIAVAGEVKAALADAYLALKEAATDPFLVIVEHSPDAGMVANAEMKRAADRFRAVVSVGSPETRETEE